MKKIFTSTIFIFILCSLPVKAQSVDRLTIEARGSWNSQFQMEQFSSKLQFEYFNIWLSGKLSENLTFDIRQRMNIPIDSDNPFRATDLLNLKWQVTPKWDLTVGKTTILIGGYEYDSAPIDVYFYSQFCTNLNQGFAFGINSGYEFTPGQSMVVQISNSPLASGFEETYAYNIAWSGHFLPFWKTVYSFNYVEDQYKRFINYIALGNHLVFGDFAVDFDLFHRASFKQERYFLTDYSFITKAIWSVNKWNFCFKAGHEYNSANNIDSNGLSFDTLIPAGTNYYYGGCGIEYFPLEDDTVRFHLAYFRNSYDHTDNFTLGLKWMINVL